ncbi:VPLPA-CTERM sorting domain-containing protein [Pelagibius sp. Alg239-R121]|uniref:VPLPA-CTERM sorting domain-containing protein n=1 Tax=Pelagibius sp. Alg239-R121 TaxID=2993448 RepID=UPI0024A72F29|nr:VPLPA-CTERM sorting domain-containing protein [Pelagibius sp. Alg239-R121]
MIRSILLAAIIAVSGSPAQAVPISAGETLRGSYTFAGSELAPQSFLLRLASADLFGNGDAVAISLLDSGLTRLTSSIFASVGTGLDPTVGITFDPGDFLPGVLPAGSPPRIPNAGFVEISALAGSFDVTAIDLFALDFSFPGLAILRQDRVSEFQQVQTGPTPVGVPVPASAWLLLMGLVLFVAMRRRSQQFPKTQGQTPIRM